MLISWLISSLPILLSHMIRITGFKNPFLKEKDLKTESRELSVWGGGGAPPFPLFFFRLFSRPLGGGGGGGPPLFR